MSTYIEHGKSLHLDDVPVSLEQWHLPVIEGLMMGDIAVEGHARSEYSLVDNLGKLGVGSDNQPVPDVIALTMYSAIPLADTLRGIFKEAGLHLPVLVGIKANRVMAHIDNVAHDFPVITEEVKRVSRVIEGAKNAVVIDQYSYKGNTIRFGKELLLRSGIERCDMIAGLWYQSARIADVQTVALTSNYSKQMEDIGRKCFRAYVE